MSGNNDIQAVQKELRQGYLILDAFLAKNRNLPTPELFRQCWNLILRNEPLFSGAATRRNRFKVDGKNLVYARFALFFKVLRKDFVPPVKLADESLGLRALPGSIFVALHSQLELAVAKLLQDSSHHVAMITAGPEQPQLLELFALSPPPDFIKRNSDCLLLAREALVKSRSLLIDVDYRVFDEERQQFLYKIGITAFSFAKKIGRPLYFVKPEVNTNGEIMCTLRLSRTEEPANEIAEHFRSFVGAAALPGNALSIGDWFSDTGGKVTARFVGRSPPG
jgi:hypothetical protein